MLKTHSLFMQNILVSVLILGAILLVVISTLFGSRVEIAYAQSIMTETCKAACSGTVIPRPPRCANRGVYNLRLTNNDRSVYWSCGNGSNGCSVSCKARSAWGNIDSCRVPAGEHSCTLEARWWDLLSPRNFKVEIPELNYTSTQSAPAYSPDFIGNNTSPAIYRDFEVSLRGGEKYGPWQQVAGKMFVDAGDKKYIGSDNGRIYLKKRSWLVRCSNDSEWSDELQLCVEEPPTPPPPPPPPASASISVSDCKIYFGKSECEAEVTWTSSNTSAPHSMRHNGTEFSTASAQSAGIPITISGGAGHTFTFSDGSGELARKNVQAVCAGAAEWNGSKCVGSNNGIIICPTSSRYTVPVGGSYTPKLRYFENATANPSCSQYVPSSQYTNVRQAAGTTWSTANPSIATVSNALQKGTITGVSEGDTTLTATYNGFTAQRTVRVGNQPRFIICPENSTVNVGDSINLEGRYWSHSSSRPTCNTSGYTIVGNVDWNNVSSGVLAIDSSGTVDALTVGDGNIRGRYQSLTAWSNFTVLANPDPDRDLEDTNTDSRDDSSDSVDPTDSDAGTADDSDSTDPADITTNPTVTAEPRIIRHGSDSLVSWDLQGNTSCTYRDQDQVERSATGPTGSTLLEDITHTFRFTVTCDSGDNGGITIVVLPRIFES